MVTLPSSDIERDEGFHKWLTSHVKGNQIPELNSILSAINDFGRKHKYIEGSIFEIIDDQKLRSLLNMMQEDKRFSFVHYGQMKQIMLVLQKYCEYMEEINKLTQQIYAVDEEVMDEPISESSTKREIKPQATVSAPQYVVKNIVALKTKNGEIYYKIIG